MTAEVESAINEEVIERAKKAFYLNHPSLHYPKQSKTNIYFIYSPGEFVKIGRAVFVLRRMWEIQSANPQELKLLGSIQAYAPLESDLHVVFSEYRERGDWFRLNDTILNFITWVSSQK